MSAREDHLAVKPKPDGRVVTTLTSLAEHTHEFSYETSWSREAFGIVYRYEDRMIAFPWSNVLKWEVFHNSDEYNKSMIEWLQTCDHEWLTHPAVGHYCKHCRLDMSDLDKLLSGKLSVPPALVSTDPSVDEEAANHEGSSPSADGLLSGASSAEPIVRVLTMSVDPMSLCGCESDGTEHDGPCRLKPWTWPITDITPDEDDNKEF